MNIKVLARFKLFNPKMKDFPMKKLWIIAFVLLAAMSSAHAGLSLVIVDESSSGSATKSQTKGYVGLSWTFGGPKISAKPDVVAGVRSVKVKSNNKVTNGADLSARFKLTEGIKFDSFRLSYVGGNRDTLGNVGLGYSLAKQSMFGTFAIQGAHSRLGLDYEFGSGVVSPYFEVLTIDKPKKVRGSSGLTCENPEEVLPPNPQVGDECIYVGFL